VEYEYLDEDDDIYQNNELIRKIVEVPRKEKNEDNKYFSTLPFVKTYDDLLAERDKDYDEQFNYDSRFKKEEYGLEAGILDEMKKNETPGIEETNRQEFFDFLVKKNDQDSNLLKKHTGIIKEKKDYKIHDSIRKEYKKKNTTKLIFNIIVAGIINKQKRGNMKKESHKRGMRIYGPIAVWYRLDEKLEKEQEEGIREPTINELYTKEKGAFDIRDIEDEEEGTQSVLGAITADPDAKSRDEERSLALSKLNPEEEFRVSSIFENGSYSKSGSVIFSSERITAFLGNTFKYFFKQLRQFYNNLYPILKTTPDYETLQYLSNNKEDVELTIKKYATGSNLEKFFIDSILWHPNLISLNITDEYLEDLFKIISDRNFQCCLTTLTIQKGEERNNKEDSEKEKFLGDILRDYKTASIHNFHFIGIGPNNTITDALKEHIRLFYRPIPDTFKEANKIHGFLPKPEVQKINPKDISYYKKLFPYEYQFNTIPIKNLTFRDVTTEAISLKNIYDILTCMSTVHDEACREEKLKEEISKGKEESNDQDELRNQHFNFPEAFNRLDISGSRVNRNEIEYLVRIINEFKVIKELDISSTKYASQSGSQNYPVIFSKLFLKNIGIYMKTDNEEANNELGYNYSGGIFPILDKIILDVNCIREKGDQEEPEKEMYNLFKKLRFFRGFEFKEGKSEDSSTSNNNNESENVLMNLLKLYNEDKYKFPETTLIYTENCS
ncbi:MAG: hypothetical protein MJ252_25570, partial [archaeon]|nr:hypothetical protein [archaeon]